MLTKVRNELAQLFSMQKMMIFLVGTILCTDVNLHVYVRDYGGTNLCEFIMYFLTNMYNVLMLATFLVLEVINDKHGIQNRYVILLRHNSRTEYYLANICAKVVYTTGCIMILPLLVFLYGKGCGLSGQETVFFQQVSAKIIVMQCVNIAFYAVLIIMVYNLFGIVLKNRVLHVLVTVGMPLVNLMLVKTGVYWLAKWFPWQRIAFQLYGWEASRYRINWEYWIILICVFWYVGDRIFGNKDIVYEDN